MVFWVSWLCVSLTCLVISIFKLNHNWMAIVGDVERCTWFIGDNKRLQVRVINCSCRNYINRWLAVPLGYRKGFVPLRRSFKREERKAPLFSSYYTQNNHYMFSWGLKQSLLSRSDFKGWHMRTSLKFEASVFLLAQAGCNKMGGFEYLVQNTWRKSQHINRSLYLQLVAPLIFWWVCNYITKVSGDLPRQVRV